MAVITITAPSGAGKTTIVKKLEASGIWVEGVSATTRKIRKKDGEKEGVTYYYMPKEEFDARVDAGEFAEYVEYDGNKYGILHKEIDRVMLESKHIVIIVEYNGYKQIKELYPDSVNIFLHMTKEDCMANMLLRGDSLEDAEKRIAKYDDEIANRGEFDYVLKNVRDKEGTLGMILSYIVRQFD